MKIISLDHLPESDIEIGELLTVVVVRAANVAQDIGENIRNLVGGNMTHYEKLIQDTVDQAIKKIEKKAQEKGYDGVMGMKIAHPMVVTGGAEIIVYGNGFKYKNKVK